MKKTDGPPQDASVPSDSPVPADVAAPPLDMPQEGGCYVRQPDGTLKRED